MDAGLWFDFDVEDLAVALCSLRSGGREELERVSTGDPSLQSRTPSSSLAAATAGAAMLLDAPVQLWVTWSGGAVAVGVGGEAVVLVMTDTRAAGTACDPGEVEAVLNGVDLEDLPSEGRALATVRGEVLAGWLWREGALVRGTPTGGTRTLAEEVGDRVVHAVAADFLGILEREVSAP